MRWQRTRTSERVVFNAFIADTADRSNVFVSALKAMSFDPFGSLVVSHGLHGKLRHNSTSRKRALCVDTRRIVRRSVSKSGRRLTGVMMADYRLTRSTAGRQSLETAELLALLAFLSRTSYRVYQDLRLSYASSIHRQAVGLIASHAA